MGRQGWQRPEEPVAQQRISTPIAEKERDRWLEGYRSPCEVNQASPATLVVNMAERAGDIQEWLVDAMRRAPGQPAEVSMRAKGKRRLAPGAVQRCGTPSIPRQTPDGDKEDGSQPTESSRLNRRVFLAPTLPTDAVQPDEEETG